MVYNSLVVYSLRHIQTDTDTRRTINAMSLEVRDNPLNLRGLAASQVGRNGGHVADALRWNAQVLQQLQLQR